MKKVTIVNGSPNKQGNTAHLVEVLLSQIDHKRISINKVELSAHKKINHCIGCDFCKKNDMHQCAFNDGLNPIINDIRNSDILIIACPIYFFNFNSLTKALIDRLFYSI